MSGVTGYEKHACDPSFLLKHGGLNITAFFSAQSAVGRDQHGRDWQVSIE